MTDKKITDLTNIVAADLVDADEFVVVDISADETMAITLGELKTAVGDGAGDLLAANNLSDLANAGTARTNLGLGTAATTASTDYATAAQGTKADAALPKVGGAMTGAITTNSTFDGRDVATDGTKLDGIEASADVTDTANVTSAGALMDSELTSIASVKALDQGVATTDSPTFNVVTAGDVNITGPTPNLRLTDNDFSAAYTNLYNFSGGTYLETRNGANDGVVVFRGLGGGTITEFARFTSAGKFGIGTNSPTGLLELSAATDSGSLNLVSTANAGDAGQKIAFFGADRSEAGEEMAYIQGLLTSNNGGSGNVQQGKLAFGTSGVEAMRIDQSGNVLVGTTTLTSNSRLQVVNSNGFPCFALKRTDANSTMQVFQNTGGATVGSISVSAWSTAYNTSSDYRLKEAWVPMSGASERVQALKPVNFAWKLDGSRVDGFLAHELQEVVPEAATGTKDAMMDEEYEVTPAVHEDIIIPAIEAVAEVPAVYDADGTLVSEMVPAVEAEAERTEQQLVSEAVMGTRSVPDMQGIDQSKLVPLLTAALQEALTRIDAMEARLVALEG